MTISMPVTACSSQCAFSVCFVRQFSLINIDQDIHTALIVKVIADDYKKDDDDSLLQLARAVLMIFARATAAALIAMILARALAMISEQRSADTFVGAR